MKRPHSEGKRIEPKRRWRTEYDGRRRNRYVGRGRKGHATNAENDDYDLGLAIRELANARELLRIAYALPSVDKRGGIVRSEAIRSALGRAALASRMVDEVVMRRGTTPGDCSERKTA